MANWVFSIFLENWDTVKQEKVWAVRSEAATKKISKGDRIVFYVSKTSHIQGSFEVISDWHKPTVDWPAAAKKDDLVGEIDLKEIQLGYADIRKLLDKLTFITKKKYWGVDFRQHPTGPSNSGRPLPDADYDTILQELVDVQQEPDFSKLKIDPKTPVSLIPLPSKKSQMAKLPEPEKKTIAEIYDDVEKERIAVPDFQRYWTWSRQQIEQLWESIFLSYYVGSLLLWEKHGGDIGLQEIVGAPFTKKGTNRPDLILDGQQRITAIYYAVKGPNLSLPNTEKPYRFFLNINALLDPNSASTDIISSYSESKVKRRKYNDEQVQFEQKIFPLTGFVEDGTYTKWLFRFLKFLKDSENYDEEEAELYYHELDRILGDVWSTYDIPIVKLPTSLLLDNVSTVFEKLNSSGSDLTVFDLLNARFIIHKLTLRKEFDRVKDTFPNIQKWYDEGHQNKLLPIYILQAISLTKKQYLRRREILNLDKSFKDSGSFDKDEFIRYWNTSAEFVNETIDRLTGREENEFGAPNYDFIPYTTLIPIIAALLDYIKNKNNRAVCLKMISFWYWNSIAGDRYSGSSDTKGEEDYKKLISWFDKGGESPLEEEKVEGIKEAGKNSALYKAVMCLITRKGALDFIQNDPPKYSELEDHHIFPQSKASKFGAGSSINSILNRTLIFERTNKIITNKDPSVYLNEIISKQGITEQELRKRLETHLISSEAFDCMKNDDFVGFITAREKTLTDEFNKMLQV